MSPGGGRLAGGGQATGGPRQREVLLGVLLLRGLGELPGPAAGERLRGGGGFGYAALRVRSRG